MRASITFGSGLRAAWWAIGVCVVLACPLRSNADDTAPFHSPADGSPASLEQIIPQAVGAYEAGDWARAQQLFEQAHALAPTARTFRSLALVAYRQGRYADAVGLFEASLVNPDKPLTPALREDAQRLLTDAREKVAAVALDARPPTPADAAALAAPIATEVPLPAQSARQASTISTRRPAAQAAAHATSGSSRPLRFKRAGYSLLAVSALALAGSGTAMVTGLVRLGRIEDHCRSLPGGLCSEQDAQAREHAARLDLLSGLALGGLVVGAVSGLGAASLLTLHYRSNPSADTRDVAVGLTLRGRF